MRLIYAASEHCADLWYESGFSAPDAFLWVETPCEKAIVVSALEYGRATKQARSDVKVLNNDEARELWGIAKETPMTIVNIIAGISKKYSDWSWQVPYSLPYGLAAALTTAGVKLSVLSPFSPGRIVKTAEEVEKIRHGVELAEAGLYRGFDVLREATVNCDGILEWNGEILTAEILRGEVDMAIAKRGGTASQTITAPGVQGADPHQTGHGPIHANEPIVMDIFPRCDATGYFGDLTRTVVKGHASDVVKRAFEAVYRVQREAIDMIKPGVIGGDVHNHVANALTAAGYPTDSACKPPHGFFHGLGHGLGLEIHESPSLSPRYDKPLAPGHVVTVEPGVYYPEWGGIRIEDVVVVTEDGCEDLTTAPVFLELNA